jgi:MscS family membrane protein
MTTIRRSAGRLLFTLFATTLILAGFLTTNSAMAQSTLQQAAKEISKKGEGAEKPEAKVAKPVGPVDEFDRGLPRTTVDGFLNATRKGDYERAAEYLDLRNLPRGMDKSQGPELARQLKIILDRALWIDRELVSNYPKGHGEDGLPVYRDSLGRIKTPEKTVDILLQRVPRMDGVHIWNFSNRTVAEIPLLYEHFGYGPFEESLAQIFPDIQVFGWQAWQWAMFLIISILAFLAGYVFTWIGGLLLRRRETDMSLQFAKLVTGPVRILLCIGLIRVAAEVVGPSVTMRGLLRAGTLLNIAVAWATVRMLDILTELLAQHLRQIGKEEATVLLRPGKAAAKVIIIIIAVLLWLDNIGFNVSTLLAGLGVGGLAVALAAQDTLKNLLGTIMILLDRPYKVGQRIVVNGHDGVVEDVGLRSTKMRLLTGHQTTVPNEQMAKVDVENIGRRPHIRRLSNITITYDTPPEKAEKAVQIIRDILDDHEGMDPEFPPRVYFNEFNPASLNILMLYWYHPPDYWGFLAFNQMVNLQIMLEFEKEGIKFAFPTTTTYLTQEDGEPLHISLGGEAQLAS